MRAIGRPRQIEREEGRAIAKRIVCTEQEPVFRPPQHAHIVAVGIGNDPGSASERLTLAEVLQQIASGVIFYTIGATSGKTAYVEPFRCTWCGRVFIRSRADSVKDNNLDSLRYCAWKAA